VLLVVPSHATDFYTSPSQASVAVSALTVALVGVVLLPGLVAIALARMRAAAVLARDAARAEAGAEARPLRPGHVVVRGEVEGDPETAVVTVRIRQNGREYPTKGGVRHQWTEVGRQVAVQPFQLRLASGDSVSVDPGRDVVLIDGLQVERETDDRRTRVAMLRGGQSVFAEGQLTLIPAGGAYRAGAATLALGRSAGAPVLLSTEPLELRHQLRASVQRSAAIWLVVTALLVNAGVYGAYWVGTLAGTVESIRVADVRAWTSVSKGNATDHYGVLVPLEGSSPVRVEVSREAYVEASAARARGEDAWIPFMRLPWGLGKHLGERPTLHFVAVALSWLLIPLLPLTYIARMRHARPWYDRPRVVDDGDGSLGGQDTLV
jgi:hypothetical protein